jgi:hypothetical protein
VAFGGIVAQTGFNLRLLWPESEGHASVSARPKLIGEVLWPVHERIEINPKIMLGKPVIRGSRITVELILRKMSEGADEKALLQADLAGGIGRDAHHPSNARMANRNIVIRNNRIRTVSQVYMDNSAILSTYVDSAPSSTAPARG